MSIPFYVAPEQVMKDKADFARKGIARGRSLVAVCYADGILFATENLSKTLHKISEIYDRIAFAGVGKFNEFDQLRQAGVRHADMKGYAYSREDVEARSLANNYAQAIGQVFTHEMKPLEIEILVAEVGSSPAKDELYHILYDGTVMDETAYCALGGASDEISEYLDEEYSCESDLTTAARAAVAALNTAQDDEEPLRCDELELAILERNVSHRAFRRLTKAELAELLDCDPNGLTQSATELEARNEQPEPSKHADSSELDDTDETDDPNETQASRTEPKDKPASKKATKPAASKAKKPTDPKK